MSFGLGFSFGGKTMYRPGILVSSSIGQQVIQSLLPFGTVCMVGESDGGSGYYIFDTIAQAQRILRSGPLLTALQRVADLQGFSQLIAVVAGSKTSASLALTGSAGATATLSDGDSGTPGDQKTFTLVAGTVAGMAATFTWVNADGTTTTYGGKGSPFDNLVNFSNLQAAMLADATITPPSATGYPAQFVLTITLDGAMTALSQTKLAGGTGGSAPMGVVTIGGTFAVGQGVQATINAIQKTYTEIGGDTNATTATGLAAAINSDATLKTQVYALANGAAGAGTVAIWSLTGTAYTLTSGTFGTAGSTATASGAKLAQRVLAFADWKSAIDSIVNVPFDMGHLVQCYDATTQAYFDGQVQQGYTYGRFRRVIHQANVTGTAATSSKQINSAALLASGQTAATALNSIRSSVCVQKHLVRDPNSGLAVWTDSAIIACGLAAFVGATGAWGPATPVTYERPATVLDVDYACLTETGDADAAVKAGVWIWERTGKPGQPGSVRCVQSVTTARTDANGNAWVFGEFSVVRASDALAANIKAKVESTSPKGIGAGNTVKTAAAIIGEVVDVLELAVEGQWITSYDKNAIEIVPTGNAGTGDILKWSAAPTLPLNNLGLAQTLIPYQVAVSTSGVVNG